MATQAALKDALSEMVAALHAEPDRALADDPNFEGLRLAFWKNLIDRTIKRVAEINEDQLAAELLAIYKDLCGIFDGPFDENDLRSKLTQWVGEILGPNGVGENQGDDARLAEDEVNQAARPSAASPATGKSEAETRSDDAAMPEVARPSGATVSPKDADELATYTKGDVRRMTGLGDTALTKYTRDAGVDVPKRGTKNHRYSTDEVRRILIAVRDGAQDSVTKDKCVDALKKLGGGP